jgi:signal transduction histidine kinase
MTKHFSETIAGQEDIAALRQGLNDIEQIVAQGKGGDSLGKELLQRISPLQERLAGLEQQLEAQALERNELVALYDVSQTLSSSLNLDQVLNRVMDQIIHLTGAERSILMLIDPDTEELTFQAARNVDRETIASSSFEISRTIVNQVANGGEPVVTINAQMDPRFKTQESVVDYNLRSILCVPLKVRGRITGVIYTDNRIRSGIFAERDRDLLAAFASQAAVAIENARLFDDIKTRNEENERLNEELKAANRELARLDQAKSDFIDIASHELRTPLTQVRGYNDILNEMIELEELTPESGIRMSQGIRKAAHRLEEIVDTMFDVCQLDTQTMSLSRSPTPLNALVKMVASKWEKALAERNQTLVIEGLQDLPSVIGDGERLKQVFTHLIQNAIKYTPDGGEIRIMGHLQDEETIKIVVADTGIGIAPDDLEHIFDKFYRVGDTLLHSTGKTKFKGAGPGLGLAIARGIVEGHGGRIWAESPGHDEETCPGSEFHIVLPVQGADQEQEENHASGRACG